MIIGLGQVFEILHASKGLRLEGRVVSVWFGLPNINGIQPDSLERWSVQVERNMSKGVLVPRDI